MSDYFPGEITIGGRVTRAQWYRMVEMECVLDNFDPQTGEDTSGAITSDGTITLHDPDATYGHFDGLEQVLREDGIPYDRQANAAYEHSGEEASFRPGMEDELVAASLQDGAGILCNAGKVVDYIERGLTLAEIMALDDGDDGIKLAILRREQPLPPFEFVTEEEG